MDKKIQQALITACKQIREGIENEDWNTVVLGYEALSGEKVEKKKDDLTSFREALNKPDEQNEKALEPPEIEDKEKVPDDLTPEEFEELKARNKASAIIKTSRTPQTKMPSERLVKTKMGGITFNPENVDRRL